MPAITASDVTVSIASDRRNVVPGASKTFAIASLTFGDGALTYPSGGVPLPAIGQYGLSRQVDYAGISAPPDSGYTYHYDYTNHKLRIYNGGTELTTAATPAAVTVRALFVGI